MEREFEYCRYCSRTIVDPFVLRGFNTHCCSHRCWLFNHFLYKGKEEMII